MIDTIRLSFPIHVSLQMHREWDVSSFKFKNGSSFICKYYNPKLENGAPVCYEYYPNSFGRGPLLVVEFSLPHVVYGFNIPLIEDITLAVELANKKLTYVENVPAVDLWQGKLTRIDICWNHYVNHLTSYYVKALQNLAYPYRRTKPYSVEGVQYQTKRATLKFYDKCLESDNIDAQGILRQETTLRSEGIRKLTGIKETKLGDLSKEMLLEFLREELRKLKILDISIGNRDTTCSQLVSKYGMDAGLYYFGFLHAKDLSPNKKYLARSLEIHPRSIGNKLKKIVDANVAPTITSYIEPLPPLTIDPLTINETTPIDASFQNG